MTVTPPRSLERQRGASGASFHDVRRELATRLRDTPLPTSAVALESIKRADDVPTVRQVDLIEGRTMRAYAVSKPDGAPTFDAFLDGAQWSIVLWADGLPLVHGTVAAAIRERRNRRMTTWREPIIRRALYAPLPLLSPTWRDLLATLDVDVIDTFGRRQPDSSHPFELQEMAYQSVLSAREVVERALGEAWCAEAQGHLFVDGGISASTTLARAPHVIGVIKSHQRLYSSGDDLSTLMRLRAGERSNVFRLAESKRAAVASWYLRLRDVEGHDPFWGLVRVEVALTPDLTEASAARRADDVSRWILGEALPLSVPDPRWDKMVYGIRDCEEYLRAIQ
jgi:hypothetical protein